MSKKKKKEKAIEGMPIEQMDYFATEMEALKQHAVKVAEELNSVRKKRTDLEDDRDCMIHYYGNAVYQLMRVEREIRRAEREVIHKEALDLSDIGKPVDIRPIINLGKDFEGYAKYAFDKYREVFKADQEVMGGRQRARNEAWERALVGELALMKVRHGAKCREIGKISDGYIAAIMEEQANAKEKQDSLMDRLEEAAALKFRRMVLDKNKQIQNIRKKHVKDVNDLRETYRDLKGSDQTIRFREEAIKLTDETSLLSSLLMEYKEFYYTHLQVRRSAKKQAKGLKEVEAKQESLEVKVQERKKRYKELEEIHYKLLLEANLIEDYEDSEKEIMETLWKDCFSEVKRTRLKQMRIYYAMEILLKVLMNELKENKQLLDRYHNNKQSNQIEELKKLYSRRRAMKQTIADLSDRALREYGLRADTLDLPLSLCVRRKEEARKRGRKTERRIPMEVVPIGKVSRPQPPQAPDMRAFGIHIYPAVLRKKSSVVIKAS